jgi:cyclopropane fatty-acyl-phospholipid synthase-like methyltransferase
MLAKTSFSKGYRITYLRAFAQNRQRCLAMSTRSHYEHHTADTYESAFFYEAGDYSESLSRLVRQRLQLEEATPLFPRTLLDIGGGTGNFSKMLVANVDAAQCIVVDPFLEKGMQSNNDGKVMFEKVPAEIFMDKAAADQEWRRKGFHQVLMKEVFHHFKSEDRPRILRGMYEGLLSIENGKERSTPSLLIITRPQTDIDYPLWDEARDVWAKNQPSLQEIVDNLESAGFVEVSHTRYPCVINLERWQSMVKSRFWSTFAEFTDEELNAACESMVEREKDKIKGDKIHFEDRLLFVSARKSN